MVFKKVFILFKCISGKGDIKNKVLPIMRKYPGQGESTVRGEAVLFH